MPRNILAAAALSMTLIALVFACSPDDVTIRCSGMTVDENWKNTQACMNKLGNTQDCYCWGNMKYYAIANTNFQAFKTCCKSKSGSSYTTSCWREIFKSLKRNKISTSEQSIHNAPSNFNEVRFKRADIEGSKAMSLLALNTDTRIEAQLGQAQLDDSVHMLIYHYPKCLKENKIKKRQRKILFF